ncbi:TNF receptor-associated factor 3, partial [Asbolus verrucosus]
GHTSVCGNVLMPCPYKCGAYVPRVDIQQHKKECVNRTGRSMTRLTTRTDCLESYDDGPLSTTSLDRKPNGPSKDLYEKLQKDFQKLSARLANFELASASTASRDSWKTPQEQQDIDRVKYQNQLLLEWKKVVDFKLETLKQLIKSWENSKHEYEFQWMGLQQKFMVLDKLQMDINLCRDTFLKEQNYNRQANLEFAKNLDAFKDLFDQENATVSALWSEQKRAIEDIRKDVDYIKQLIEEQKAKHTSVVFDIKTISQIASETSEKLEIQEREFAKFRQQFDQLKLDLEILENLAAGETKSTNPARDSNTVLRSPIFYTHDFGYKIRVLAYLDGLKKWKGRYALISVHVLKGEFDPLLKWPCHIEGTVTLRDLENLENPKNFSKRVVAKRQTGDEENEEPQESSFSYIFIPHATLMKSQFLKEDAVYLEIRIEQNRKLLTETTL